MDSYHGVVAFAICGGNWEAIRCLEGHVLAVGSAMKLAAN